MNNPAKARCSVIAIACLCTPLGHAAEPNKEMSFFEFLGTTVIDGHNLVDPLSLYDDGIGATEDNAPPTLPPEDSPKDDNQYNAERELAP